MHCNSVRVLHERCQAIAPPPFPALRIMLLLRKCSRNQNVIIHRLGYRMTGRLCGRVYKAEDIVEDVVSSIVLLEVEYLGEAHRPVRPFDLGIVSQVLSRFDRDVRGARLSPKQGHQFHQRAVHREYRCGAGLAGRASSVHVS